MTVSSCRRRLLEHSLFAGLLAMLPPAASRAHCLSRQFTEPDALPALTKPFVLVTHASSEYDSRMATKSGLDALVHHARIVRMPVIYLADDSPLDGYFARDCAPTAWVFSEGGELSFRVGANHVLLAGGHLELCLNRTIHGLLDQWGRLPPRDRRLTLVADAIYANAREIDGEAPYARDIARFLDIVASARPGGEHWRKLTLLEAMAIIRDDAQRSEFLASVVPAGPRAMPAGWQIKLRWDDVRERILRPARGPVQATLTYEIIDSMFER
ncbi:MAG: hypothetical protein R3E83_08795 [Burkholderiaceae bacterium]